MTPTLPSVIGSPSLGEVAKRFFHANFGMTLHEWYTFMWRNRDDVFVVPGLRGLLIATKVAEDTAHIKCFFGNAAVGVTLLRLFRASHPELRFITYKCTGRDSIRNRPSHLRKISISRLQNLLEKSY